MATFKAEQLAAIEAQGKTIVSASAGSGKTTVMIEKIVRLILSGVPVESILALTYTKKAAAQMKEKLRDALIKKINAPSTSKTERAHLKTQLNAVQTADVSTVHSFCAKLLRQNFFEGEVSNTFSVIASSDADGKTLLSNALNEIFAEAYKTGEEDFELLLSLYFKKKKDKALRDVLLSTYEALRSRADYLSYLENCGNADETRFKDICAGLVKDLHERCEYYLAKLGEEEAFFAKQKKCERSLALVAAVDEYLYALRAQKDYFCCAKLAAEFPNSQSVREGTPQEIALHIRRLKNLVKDVKEMRDTLAKTNDYDEEYARFAFSMKVAKALAKYLLQLDAVYQRLKAEKDVLDYADLEHFALKLLRKQEMQTELHKKYAYVFVDEYQDVNPVQEQLLSALTGENLFLVGDVKQSIYGFRGSKSQFFIDKERQYKQEGNNALFLPQNFRSAPAVLEAVNTQFSAMMTLQNTSVDYKKDGKMVSGGLYVDEQGKEAYGRVRVHFCDKLPAVGKDEISGVYSVKEGKKKGEKGYSAQVRKILKIVQQEEKYGQYFSVKTNRYEKVTYGDIAILYRGMSGEVRDLVAAFEKEGVPTVGGESVNVCDYPEIKTLIDILSLLDNERQDIPLCSALLSLGGLDNNQLAKIRLWEKENGEEKRVPFYAACKAYASNQTDEIAHLLKGFYDRFARLRMLAQVQTAGEVLTKLLGEKGLETQFLSRVGEDCLARIHRFIEESSKPEPMSVRVFLDRLKSLDYEIICPVSGGENAVKMMTMHASKGLEFPVVVLMDLGKKLHDVGDSEVLVNDEFGLAPFYRDRATRGYYPTLLRTLHVQREGREQVKDELNLYYVAATRAQYAMHLVYKERTDFCNTMFGDSFQAFTDFSLWEKFVYEEEPYEIPYPFRKAFVQNPKAELVKKIEESLQSEYAYKGLENFPVKDSATGLMKKMQDPFSAQEAQKSLFFRTDDGDLLEGDKKERGLAYHAFLEHFDFAKIKEGNLREQVSVALEKFRLEKTFDERYFNYLQVEKLCEILSAPVFRGLDGCKLYKERAFLVGLPIKEVLRLQGAAAESIQDGDAEVLFQGAIDLLAVGKDKTYIVDYKYSSGNAEYLKTHYAPQLSLYKKAVSKITGRAEEDIQTVIVNIALGFAVEL